MDSNYFKILAAKVYSQNKNWEFGVSQTTVADTVIALKEAASNVDRIAELEKELLEYKSGLGVFVTNEQFSFNNITEQASDIETKIARSYGYEEQVK